MGELPTVMCVKVSNVLKPHGDIADCSDYSDVGPKGSLVGNLPYFRATQVCGMIRI